MADNVLYATSLVALMVVIAGFFVFVVVRARRGERDRDRLQVAVASGLSVPASLHPVINLDTCIGSLSCLKACPEGDILGLVDGRAHLVTAANCIGHSRCAAECPVGAIELVFGTRERAVMLPQTDGQFESNVPGLFVVGELGGMGLIKNALRQGLSIGPRVALRVQQARAAGATAPDDVIIVGAGPAGLAAAVACRQAGLRFTVFEQGAVGGAVQNFPRGKVVMNDTVDIPGYGPFGADEMTKDELIASFKRIVRAHHLDITDGVRVGGVQGALGGFVVDTSQGPHHAAVVVMALGVRGTPRRLGLPGEHAQKVTFGLADPRQYDGRRVLVVGGGDSAVEAAIQLADESDAEVVISHRRAAFTRCRPINRERIGRLVANQRVRAVMSSVVAEIGPDAAVLRHQDGQETLPNDNVIVCIGGSLPTPLLERAGVTLRRYTGERQVAARDDDQAAAGRRRRVSGGVWLALLGTALFAGLLWVGGDYYTVPVAERDEHALHRLLRPSGLWGHGIGVVATLFMLSNFLYSMRKRLGRLKRAAPIRRWLTFHMFVGVMSPVVIAFHAAFLFRNLLAVWTWVALFIVVSTGVFGRFLYGLIPSAQGKLLALTTLEERFAEGRVRLERVTGSPARAAELMDLCQVPRPLTLGKMILHVPRRRRALSRFMHYIEPEVNDPRALADTSAQARALILLKLQVAAYRELKGFFRLWLALHVSLASFMVLLITAHVGLSIYLGFRWLW